MTQEERALVRRAMLLLPCVCCWLQPLGAQAERHCGTERWPVKVLADRDRVLIDTIPIVTTIAHLGAIAIPDIPYPNDRRIVPYELRTYRVVAVIDQILAESDGDWHIVLRDPEDDTATMIAEIPDPTCAANPEDGARYAKARQGLRGLPRRGRAIVEGVGFFDFIHNQRGRARNGFELHPVLLIRLTGA